MSARDDYPWMARHADRDGYARERLVALLPWDRRQLADALTEIETLRAAAKVTTQA